jgi:hypothetical protein
MLLHPRYDSNVGEAERATSLQDKAKLRVLSLIRLRRLLGTAVSANHHDAKRKQ